MNTPLVSVIVPTFNESAPIIKDAIESIKKQTYTNWELIIVDDSTSEETIAVIDEYGKETKISVYRSSKRLGVSASRNLGMLKAKGKYIAFLDGDDVALPDRLEVQLEHFQRHPNVSILGSAMYIVNATGVITAVRKYPTRGMLLRLWTMFRSPLAQPTVMFHRKVIDIGLKYDPTLRRSEDLDLWLKAMGNSLIIENVSKCLLRYRVCDDLSLRRKKDHWAANLLVRKRNFTWKHPIFSLISVSVAFLFTLVPRSVVRFVYSVENGRWLNNNKKKIS